MWAAAFGGYSSQKREGSKIEYEAGLVESLAARRLIINASNKVDAVIEGKLRSFPNQGILPFWVSFALSIGSNPLVSSGPNNARIDVERTRSFAIDSLRWLVGEKDIPRCAPSLGIPADTQHLLIWKWIEFVKQQLAGNEDILSWRVPHVFDHELDPKNGTSVIVGGETLGFDLGQHHPRPLFISQFRKLLESEDRRSSGASGNSNGENSGEKSEPERPLGQASRFFVAGLGLIMVGAMLSYKGGNAFTDSAKLFRGVPALASGILLSGLGVAALMAAVFLRLTWG